MFSQTKRLNSLGSTSKPTRLNREPNPTPRREIIRSVEELGLPAERAIIVGSAALYLYGIELPEMFDDGVELPGPRPHDIDLTIDALTYLSLLESGKTPSGKPVSEKKGHPNTQAVLEVDARPLAIDLVSRFPRSNKSGDAFDKGFNKHYINKQNSIQVPGSSVRVASPQHLKRELKTQARFDQKARKDLAAFNQQAHKINRSINLR